MPFGLPSPHCHISQHLAINILIYIHSTGSILQLNSNWKDKTYCKNYIIFSSVRLLSHVRLFATPWTTACQASLPITNSWSLLKLMSIEQVMPSTISFSVIPISHFQSFPASGSFPRSQLFASGGPSIGVSASISVFPMNIQDWFPLGWTGWISLQSKGLSRVLSTTTVQKHQFFGTQLSLYYRLYCRANGTSKRAYT